MVFTLLGSDDVDYSHVVAKGCNDFSYPVAIPNGCGNYHGDTINKTAISLPVL